MKMYEGVLCYAKVCHNDLPCLADRFEGNSDNRCIRNVCSALTFYLLQILHGHGHKQRLAHNTGQCILLDCNLMAVYCLLTVVR